MKSIRTQGQQEWTISALSAHPTPLPCVTTFTDVYPNQYFYRAVDWLVCRGIVRLL